MCISSIEVNDSFKDFTISTELHGRDPENSDGCWNWNTIEAMRKRRSHNKSRAGCNTCKKRHIKCDESGPPCANCRTQRVECLYVSRNSPTTSVAVRTSSSSGTTPSEHSLQQQRRIPEALDISQDFRRILELNLMHRWTSNTWKAFSCRPEDATFCQQIVPREALGCSWLLGGLFATSAIEMILCSKDVETDVYFRAAMDYMTKSTKQFRRALSNIAPESQHLLFMYSIMSVVINFMVPLCIPKASQQPNMLERIQTFFGLMRGPQIIAKMSQTAYMCGVLPSGVPLGVLADTCLDSLSDDTVHALELLRTANREIHGSQLAIFHDGEESSSASTTDIQTNGETYDTVIDMLQLRFAEDAKDGVKMYNVYFCNAAGPEFHAAVDRAEPMAILILLYWGVLMDSLTSDYWWARLLGSDMVSQLSKIALDSRLAEIPAARQGIAWARQKVGLENLQEKEIEVLVSNTDDVPIMQAEVELVTPQEYLIEPPAPLALTDELDWSQLLGTEGRAFPTIP
jgi:hypothetical protein